MGGLWNTTAWGQQTAAAKLMAAKASGSRGGMRSARRRKRKVKASATRRKARAPARRSKARLVKGSRAAKAYMAKIRRRRK